MIIPRARDWISLFQFFQTINRRNLSERKVISFDKGVTSAAAGRFNLAAGLELGTSDSNEGYPKVRNHGDYHKGQVVWLA